MTSSQSVNSLTFKDGGFQLFATAGEILSIGAGGITVLNGVAATSFFEKSMTIQLTADQTWSNNTNVTPKVLSLQALSVIKGDAGMGQTRTLTFTGTSTATSTISSSIRDGDNGGNVAVVMNSGIFQIGTTTSGGASTFTGGVTLNGGTLKLGGATALGTGSLTINGGSLDVPGAITLTGANPQFWNADFGFTGTNTLNLGTGAVTMSASRTITTNASTLTVGGSISGSGFGITKAGAGTLTLSNAANTYNGPTTITAGMLSVSTLAAGGANSGVGSSSNAATNLVINGGTFQYTGAAGSTDRLFSVGTGGATINANTASNGAFNFTNLGALGFNGQTGARTLTLAGTSTGDNTLVPIIGDNGGPTAITKSGAGTWVLAGANTFTGTITLTAGSLTTATANINGGDTTNGIVFNGGTLKANLGGISTAKSVTLTGAGTFNSNGNNSTLSGVITGSGAFTKSGAGTLTLTGTNNYTGLTTISVGTLNIQNSSALGGIASGVSITSGAALELQGGITVGAEALTLRGTGISSGGALRNISGNNTYGGLITLGAASRINSDAGTLTLNNASPITGTFALTVGGSGDTAISSVIATTTGSLTKDGSGKLTLSGANTYTGATTINAGVVNIQNDTALGTTAGGVSIVAGSALQIQGGITVGAEAMTLRGTGISNDGALRNIAGTNDYSGLVTLGAASRINSDAGTLILSNVGTISGAGFGLSVGGAGDTSIASIIGTTTGTFTKDGVGTVTLSGANTFTGQVTVQAGKLAVATVNDQSASGPLGNNALPVILGNAGNGTGTLQYTGATASSTKKFTMAAGGNGAFQIDNAGTNLTVSGVVDGSGALVKTGAGTLTLSGLNSYSGSTSVVGGKLALGSTGTLASTNLSIGQAGIFDVQAKVGGFSLAGMAVTISTDGSAAGLLDATGVALTLGGNLNINFTSAILADGFVNLADFGSETGDFSSVTLIGDVTGSLTRAAQIWTGFSGGYNFSFDQGTGVLSFSSIPEPSTYAVGIFGLLVFVAAVRKRKALRS
jgi:autotransporter-associated beta strand protein